METGRHGEPTAVIWRGAYSRVAAIHDTWRIDDEWWRDEIARRYYVVELEGGRRLTLYRSAFAILREDAPVVPLFQDAAIYGARKELRWRPTPDEAFQLMDMSWQP